MPQPTETARNARIAWICAATGLVMVGAAFASVPLYRVFCQATGFNGAVRREASGGGPIAPSAATVTVDFDTNVHGGLPWRFVPEQGSQTVHFGENKLAFFRATNLGPRAVTGRAVYNVVPEAAGPYFAKLECFCFKNQTLQPGQSAEFPVVYTVDPRYAHDRDTRQQSRITLSYTFLPAAGPNTAAALGGSRGRRL